MASPEFEELEYLSRDAAASLLALLALQAVDNASTAATTALIHWHLGEADTPGEPWDTVHQPENYIKKADISRLTTQNNAARSLISHLIGASVVVAAWRTFELIEPSAHYEAPNETATTWYMAAEISAADHDLAAETKWRTEAEAVWFRAECTGKQFNAGQRLTNRQALRDCQRRTTSKPEDSDPIVDIPLQLPRRTAGNLGIPVYYQGVLPANTGIKSTQNTL